MENKARGLLTVKAFARLKHQDPFTVYRQIWRGKIKVLRQKSGRYLIPASQLLSQLGKKGV